MKYVLGQLTDAISLISLWLYWSLTGYYYRRKSVHLPLIVSWVQFNKADYNFSHINCNLNAINIDELVQSSRYYLIAYLLIWTSHDKPRWSCVHRVVTRNGLTTDPSCLNLDTIWIAYNLRSVTCNLLISHILIGQKRFHLVSRLIPTIYNTW